MLTPPGAGRLNQAEFTERIDPILASPDGSREHLHNQLIAAIYGNVTREMPDQGLAPWVSANDKPSAAAGSKPVSGDAAERRLKGEVMQLPARDRRRIKDLVQNDVSWGWALSNDCRLFLTMPCAVRPIRVTSQRVFGPGPDPAHENRGTSQCNRRAESDEYAPSHLSHHHQ